jgi:hypothetical protein
VHPEIDTPSNSSDASGELTENPDPETVTVAPSGPWPGLTEMAGVVTVNVVLAVWPPASTAVTVDPEVPPGTAKVQAKLPETSVPSEPLAQLETGTSSKVREARVVDTEKPVPDTVTVAPCGPWPGLTEIAGVVTVKVVEAVWPPTSVTVTVVPEVPAGTANVHEKSPEASVPSEPDVQLETVTPSKLRPTVLDTENPEPDTVTVAPSGPWPGLTDTDGVVTLNVPLAVWPPTSVAVTMVPEVPLGTAKAHEKSPEPSVPNDPPEQLDTVTPSKTSPTVLSTEKPVPETVTEAPTGPWLGLTKITGVVTVKLPLAVCPPPLVAITDVPEVPPGTANVQLKLPEEPVTNDPLEQLETETLSKTRDATDVDALKPVPETVTVAPAGPWFGLTEMAGRENVTPTPKLPPLTVKVGEDDQA